MVRPARIDNHAMQRTTLLDDPIHRRSDGCLFGHIRLEALQLPGPPLLRGGELVAGIGVVDRVDYLSAIVEAGLCDAEADAAVGSGDCGLLAMTGQMGGSDQAGLRTSNDLAAQ